MSRYKQLMAAGGPQVLTMGSICGRDAAIFHVVWCLVLQTEMNRYTTVAHSLYCTRSGTSSQCSSSWSRLVSPRSYFRVSVTTRAAAFITRWSLFVVDLDAPARMALQ